MEGERVGRRIGVEAGGRGEEGKGIVSPGYAFRWSLHRNGLARY